MKYYFNMTGGENLKQIARDFPEFGYRRSVMTGFREAAKPVRAAMLAGLPPALKKMRKVLKGKTQKGKEPVYAVGFWGNSAMYINSRGQKWNPYQLIYWFNYGTRANRDGSHMFKFPRRQVSKNCAGGLKPLRFVETSWDKSKSTAEKKFSESTIKSIDKFFQSRAAQ